MKSFQYNDGMQPGKRTPRLFFVNTVTGEMDEFTGVSLPGVVVVTASKYTKQGNWSHTEFTLAYNEEKFMPVRAMRKLHGPACFPDKGSLNAMKASDCFNNPAEKGMDSDTPLKNLSDEQMENFVKTFFPVAWEKFQETQQMLVGL